MQRNVLRAVALTALMVLSVFAGVPLASEPATADDDTDPFEQTDTHETDTDEFWLHSYAAYDGELFVAGALEDQIYVFDSEIDDQRTYGLEHEPAGLARFDGSWIVSSGDEGTLERYDDEFEHVETVVDSGFEDESTSAWSALICLGVGPRACGPSLRSSIRFSMLSSARRVSAYAFRSASWVFRRSYSGFRVVARPDARDTASAVALFAVATSDWVRSRSSRFSSSRVSVLIVRVVA